MNSENNAEGSMSDLSAVGGSRPEHRSLYRYVLLFVLLITFVATVGASLLMAALFGVGLHHIWMSVWLGFHPEDGRWPEATGIQWAIHGLEFLYLAPLAFMVLYSLTRYIESHTAKDQATAMTETRRDLLHVKGLVISLLIAVIATDLVGKMLGRGLGMAEAISESVVVVVLMGYFALLEILSGKRK
jgi:hypothetical protein